MSTASTHASKPAAAGAPAPAGAAGASAPAATINSCCQYWYEKGRQEGYEKGRQEGKLHHAMHVATSMREYADYLDSITPGSATEVPPHVTRMYSGTSVQENLRDYAEFTTGNFYNQ
jgi:hypothetical protein